MAWVSKTNHFSHSCTTYLVALVFYGVLLICEPVKLLLRGDGNLRFTNSRKETNDFSLPSWPCERLYPGSSACSPPMDFRSATFPRTSPVVIFRHPRAALSRALYDKNLAHPNSTPKLNFACIFGEWKMVVWRWVNKSGIIRFPTCGSTEFGGCIDKTHFRR